ncbi:MAG: AMP phosphorylase [Candidatus Hadarchaeales archaeon]
MKTITLRIKPLDIETGKPIAIMHEEDAEKIGHVAGSRIKVYSQKGTFTIITNTTRNLVAPGELGTCKEATCEIGLEAGSEVKVTLAPRPASANAIKKKLDGKVLTQQEIDSIIRDIVADNLTATELAAFVTAVYTRGMTVDEIVFMVRSMVESGEKLEIERRPILDVHSIGGVPGNKYALLTVPIVSAAGLTVPKTSRRAITSAAGTADVMEVLAPVSLELEEIKAIVEKIGAVLVWGGALRLAPADDIIIRAERVLAIDPTPQLLASVMAKKLAVGAEKIVIDTPTGSGAKVETIEEARRLAHDFIELARRLGVQLEAAITYGGQPIGYAVGPALEAREALETLMGMNGPGSLIEKATGLAGLMLELGGITPIGFGKQMALEILKSGKAYEQMKRIIEAQGGDPNVKIDDIPVGDKVEVLRAPVSGYIKQIDNHRINEIARAAGAPEHKGAGIKLLMKEGRKVEKGDPILEIYAEHESKLDEALDLARTHPPVRIEGMLIERISHSPRWE